MHTRRWVAALGLALVATACAENAEPGPAATEQATTQPAPNTPAKTVTPQPAPAKVEGPVAPAAKEEEPLTCASIAKRAPAGAFTFEGPGAGLDTSKVVDVSASMDSFELNVDEAGVIRRHYSLGLAFSTQANTCLYERIGGLPSSNLHIALSFGLQAAETADPFPVGSTHQGSVSFRFGNCTSNEDISQGSSTGEGMTSSITITKNTGGELVGTFVITNLFTNEVRTGTFRAPICAPRDETPLSCCAGG